MTNPTRDKNIDLQTALDNTPYASNMDDIIQFSRFETLFSSISDFSKEFSDKLQALQNMGSSVSVTDLMLIQHSANRLNQMIEAGATISAFLKDLVSTIMRQVK